MALNASAFETNAANTALPWAVARPAALTSWPWQLASEALVEWSAKNWSWKQDPKRKATHISLLLRSCGIEKLFLCFEFIYHLPIIWLGNWIRSSNRLNFGSTALAAEIPEAGRHFTEPLVVGCRGGCLALFGRRCLPSRKAFQPPKVGGWATNLRIWKPIPSHSIGWKIQPCVNSPATSRWEESAHGTNIIAPLKKCWGQPFSMRK